MLVRGQFEGHHRRRFVEVQVELTRRFLGRRDALRAQAVPGERLFDEFHVMPRLKDVPHQGTRVP
jgi:hypothetical protein